MSDVCHSLRLLGLVFAMARAGSDSRLLCLEFSMSRFCYVSHLLCLRFTYVWRLLCLVLSILS